MNIYTEFSCSIYKYYNCLNYTHKNKTVICSFIVSTDYLRTLMGNIIVKLLT